MPLKNRCRTFPSSEHKAVSCGLRPWDLASALHRLLSDTMFEIVTSADRDDRHDGQQTIHRFRFDGWIHGSSITPFALVGTLLFDSSASEEHRYFPRAINVAR